MVNVGESSDLQQLLPVAMHVYSDAFLLKDGANRET